MKFLDIDGKLWEILHMLLELITLSVLFFLLCLPVVTVGAAPAAAMETPHRHLPRQEDNLLPTFWVSFRKNFRPCTLCWLATALILLLLKVDLQILEAFGGLVFVALSPLCQILTFYSAAVFLWAMCYLAHYEDSFGRTLRNAFLLSLSSPLRTGGLMVMVLLSVWIFELAGPITLLLPGLILWQADRLILPAYERLQQQEC